jgi:hypothetical protein
MSGTLLEDLDTFCCCQRRKFAIKLLLCNTHYCYIVCSDMYLNNTNNALLGFYCNNGYASHCYGMRTLPLLFTL